jgi:uncharacterized protein with HEPN domain
MPERKPLQTLEDILDAVDKIFIYTSEMSFQEFTDNDQVIDAVLRNFEVIGEAANRLPCDFKSENESIEWRQIIGFRNYIIHEYFQIDYEKVWQIKEGKLRKLAEATERLIDKLYLQSGQ